MGFSFLALCCGDAVAELSRAPAESKSRRRRYRTTGIRPRSCPRKRVAIRAARALRKFFCGCELLHTARTLPGATFRVPCIVIAMRLQRTTTMNKSVLMLLSGRTLAAAAIASAVAIAAPTPAEARIGTGAAIGIGLGSFALGTAIGAGAYANPYGYYPYGYYGPAPAYYAPTPVYSYPRSCWYPQYGAYYAC